MEIEFRVVIPVRYDSKRLPGKPLMDIKGKPMLQHVYERAIESGAVNVVIATDNDKICKVAEGFGANVCITSKEHRSGTDRIAEAVVAMGYEDDDIVVNLQGDEPIIPPQVIHQVAQNLAKYENARVATLYEPIKTIEELFDPDNVKVVIGKRGYALYFSRAPIAWERDNFKINDNKGVIKGAHYRHVGLYAYHVKFLQEYMEWEPAPLEEMEHLEQLRVLWNGGRVHVARAKLPVPGDVNTPEDLEKIRKSMKKK